jgi:hypothetical protein
MDPNPYASPAETDDTVIEPVCHEAPRFRIPLVVDLLVLVALILVPVLIQVLPFIRHP